MPNSGLNETAAPPANGRLKVEYAEPRFDLTTSIRDLTYADLPPVISIERRSFRSPWSIGMFALEMSKADTISLAAVDGSRMLGYLVLSRFDRAWHLMNIAVAPEHRRCGVASDLVRATLERIESHEPVTLEVRPSNRSAICLYEGFGFRSHGLRPGYYPDNGEDALIMWRGDPRAAGVPLENLGDPAGV